MPLAERLNALAPGATPKMELVRNRDANAQDADLTEALTQLAGRKGLILLACGVRGNVIRFLAPLTISGALLAEGLDIVERCLRELTAGQRPAAAAAG